MYSACKLNKRGDNIKLCRTPFPIWKQPVLPCPVITVASWSAYRFLKRQVRSPVFHLFKNFLQFVVIHIFKGFGIVNKAGVDIFLENISRFWTYNFHNFLLNYSFIHTHTHAHTHTHIYIYTQEAVDALYHFWKIFTHWNNEFHSAKLFILLLSFCIWIYRNALSYEENLQPIILVQRNLSNLSFHLGKMSISSMLFCKENQSIGFALTQLYILN